MLVARFVKKKGDVDSKTACHQLLILKEPANTEKTLKCFGTTPFKFIRFCKALGFF
jgi:hypothetical protein